MALVTISGEPASRWEDVAHGVAQILGFELVTETRLEQWIREEFGPNPIPERAWKASAVTILARLACNHHLAIAVEGADALFPTLDYLFEARIVAPLEQRIGNAMLDFGIDRPQAAQRLASIEIERKRARKSRVGRSVSHPPDVVLNIARRDPAVAAEILAAAVEKSGLKEHGFLPEPVAEELQFSARMTLAQYSVTPAGKAEVARSGFGHPSEKLFANLLDFYRIEWVYEPRSFPLQWNKDGQVTEAFTPDFYLPEFDLYVELTTMKQSLVTRKNRKVKLLRAIYPHVNIQIFYQKDFQDLVLKHGLPMAAQ